MNFEEFFNFYCGNFNNNDNKHNGAGGFGYNDIPGGFQDVDPSLFVTLSSLIGLISAQNLPSNVQAAIGNWLLLLGQSILTYNSQVQYFQNGPGDFFDIRNKNKDNNNYPNSSEESSTCNCEDEIKKLKKQIEKLSKKIDKLENK